MGLAIGIDLGTTNSCAAIMENGRPRVLTYKGGDSTIPSVFAIDEKGNRLVGQEAKRQAQLNPTNTVMAAKRLIGRNFHSKTIDKVRQIFTYEMLEGDNSEVLIKVKGEVFTLEQISAAILSRIRDVAEEALGEEVDQAVITVPAYFNDRQRQAVRNAGKMAGLHVLRILNEPTAAALAYGRGKNLSQRVAVYDLGGGTFDISVIDIKDRIFEVIATGGDTFLGGVDFDDRLMQFVLEKFHAEHGVDLAWDRVAIQRIRDASEGAKIELSTVTETHIHIPYITKSDGKPLDINLRVTRDQLEELTMDLVQRTVQTCSRIFKEAGTTIAAVDEVLLVGGQSRMPLVQKQITAFIGKPPSKGVHPDEAVAMGAAIMAHSLSTTSNNDVTLLDVLPMPIGINKVDGTMHVLFQKNQPLPDYKTRTLTTSKDNQRSIMLRLYQGESRLVAENERLGTFVFSNIRPAAKGQVQIEVTFHIDSEGILNLTARDKETSQTVDATLKLGKGGKDSGGRKRRRPATSSGRAAPPKREPKKKAVTPPSLNMPTSSLAQSISGGNAQTPPPERPTPPPIRPVMPSNTAPINEPPPEPLIDDAEPETPDEHEMPDIRPTVDRNLPANSEQMGFFARIMAWFRNLFSRG
ncbi:MAG: Hsp70 family protein [Myxococcota bacterium]